MHFSLNDIEIKINLGVPKKERSILQIVRIKAKWEINAEKAANSDDINDTVDYFQIEQLIRKFPKQKSWHLLEKLHTDLKNEIQKKFPQLKNLIISITKYPFINGSISVSD